MPESHPIEEPKEDVPKTEEKTKIPVDISIDSDKDDDDDIFSGHLLKHLFNFKTVWFTVITYKVLTSYYIKDKSNCNLKLNLFVFPF